VSALEWLLISELVLLGSAGFFYIISLMVAGKDPDDPLSVFWRTFWKVFLRRRVKFKVALASLEHSKAQQYHEMKQHGDVDGIKDLLREELDEHEVDDSELAKLLEVDAQERAAAGFNIDVSDASDAPALRTRVATINVKVIPFSERDEIGSFGKDGAIIKVVNGPEDGRSNKAVIQLLAAHFRVKPYQISLLKGHYRARKYVQIAGMDQAQLDAKVSSFS
jgi:uncharacterized protein YggU (UPF0235/DUF167 family)